MSFAAAVDAPHIAAEPVDRNPGVDRAAVGLPARDRACVFVELSAFERKRRVVTRCGVEADRAGVVAEYFAAEIVATDAVEPCLPFVDMERRLELSDLLAHETHAFQLQSPSTSRAMPLDQPLTFSSCPWMCSIGIAVLIELSMKKALVFFHRHHARSRLSPDQPISRSPRARNGPPPSSRRANWAMSGGIFLRRSRSNRISSSQASCTLRLNRPLF